MGNITISSRSGTLKATLPRVLQAAKHDSLSGEKTFSCRVRRSSVPTVNVGDVLSYGGESYDVVRLSVQSASPAALAELGCEHISYRLLDWTVAAGTYSGTPSQLLSRFLFGTGFSAGTVQLSSSVELIFGSDTNVRAALVGLAAMSGGELLYSGTTVSLMQHIGSSAAVELSDRTNVESISATLDQRSDSQSYNVTLYKETALSLGDAVSIDYDSLGLHTTDRVVSIDVDPFNPLHMRIVTGDYVPNFVNATADSQEEIEEAVLDEVESMIEDKLDDAIDNAIYADVGDIAELTVDRLSTSRRVRKYILGDTSDDNYIMIQDNVLQLRTGTVASSSMLATEDDDVLATEADDPIGVEGSATNAVQATNRWGQLLYWQHEPVGHTAQGYPTDINGNQIYATTTPTDWPVMVYQYVEQVKAEYSFVDVGGVYTPQIILGAGDTNGNSKGYIFKTVDELLIRYLTSAGSPCEIALANDGFVEIRNLRRALNMDFASWDAGYFTETLDGGVVATYSVQFDAQGRPVKIFDADHACTISW